MALSWEIQLHKLDINEQFEGWVWRVIATQLLMLFTNIQIILYIHYFTLHWRANLFIKATQSHCLSHLITSNIHNHNVSDVWLLIRYTVMLSVWSFTRYIVTLSVCDHLSGTQWHCICLITYQVHSHTVSVWSHIRYTVTLSLCDHLWGTQSHCLGWSFIRYTVTLSVGDHLWGTQSHCLCVITY